LASEHQNGCLSNRCVRLPAVLGLLAGVCWTQLQAHGVDWEQQTPPPNAALMLNGVWGSGPNDVFVVGYDFPCYRYGGAIGGRILHYDGSNWSLMYEMPGTFLYGAWGSGPNDVFVVGSAFEPNWTFPIVWLVSGAEALAGNEASDSNSAIAGLILHYDGQGWSRMDSGTSYPLYGIWGTGPNEVVAVGGLTVPPVEGEPSTECGIILRYDGSNWSEMWSGTTLRLKCIWGSGPNDIFTAGDRGGYYGTSTGVIMHYNSSGWSEMWSASGAGIGGVWGTGPNNVYAAAGSSYVVGGLLHYDGSQWSPVHDAYAPYGFNAIWGSGPNDVFAVGGGGSISHYDGTHGDGWLGPYQVWVPMVSGTTNDLYGVWGSGPMDVFAVGGHLPRNPGDTSSISILHYGHFFVLTIDTVHGEWGQVTYTPPPSLSNPLRYVRGTAVTLTATPAAGKGFAGWEVYDPNYPGDANYAVTDANATTTVIMDADRQVRAVFSSLYSLEVSTRNMDVWSDGYVTVEPNLAVYLSNSRVTLTAFPVGEQIGYVRLILYDPNHPGDSNYAEPGPPAPIGPCFRCWEIYDPNHPNDANFVTLDANNPTTIVMDADRQVTAVFGCGRGASQVLPLLVLGVSALSLVSRRLRRRHLECGGSDAALAACRQARSVKNDKQSEAGTRI
jgi:hypothetical protein